MDIDRDSPHMTSDDTVPTAASPTCVDAVSQVSTPTALWRLDDDPVDAPTPGVGGFAARLACRLVFTYTRRGEHVIDFDGDDTLRTAAAATARRYIPVTGRARITDLDSVTGPGCLITVGWPREASAAADSVHDLVLACQLIASTTPTTLAIVSAAQTPRGHVDATAPLETLLVTATARGFTHELCILAFRRPGECDQFVYCAADADVDAALRRTQATTRVARRIDMLRYAPAASTQQPQP